MMCFTETWLSDEISDGCIMLDGFVSIRSDRTLNSGKAVGGGVCIYINKRWCNNWCVKEKFCDADVELLAVGLRPYYLPREFSQLFVIIVYMPPDANKQNAVNKITQTVIS